MIVFVLIFLSLIVIPIYYFIYFMIPEKHILKKNNFLKFLAVIFTFFIPISLLMIALLIQTVIILL